MSAVTSQISFLEKSLSSDSKILSNPRDEEFLKLMERWTEIDLKIPGAIVLPISEEDVQKTVSWSL